MVFLYLFPTHPKPFPYPRGKGMGKGMGKQMGKERVNDG